MWDIIREKEHFCFNETVLDMEQISRMRGPMLLTNLKVRFWKRSNCNDNNSSGLVAQLDRVTDF